MTIPLFYSYYATIPLCIHPSVHLSFHRLQATCSTRSGFYPMVCCLFSFVSLGGVICHAQASRLGTPICAFIHLSIHLSGVIQESTGDMLDQGQLLPQFVFSLFLLLVWGGAIKCFRAAPFSTSIPACIHLSICPSSVIQQSMGDVLDLKWLLLHVLGSCCLLA
jgi:hypothetical protein